MYRALVDKLEVPLLLFRARISYFGPVFRLSGPIFVFRALISCFGLVFRISGPQFVFGASISYIGPVLYRAHILFQQLPREATRASTSSRRNDLRRIPKGGMTWARNSGPREWSTKGGPLVTP